MKKLLTMVLALSTLPGSALAYKSSIAEPVAMRDSVHLATDVYWPSKPGKYPTILIRTPYGTDFIDPSVARILCDRMKFAAVVQDTRGRYESEGTDDVFMSDGWGEHQDGYDTLEWISQQSWSDGQVGIFGASALAITGYLAAGTYHPALKAIHNGIAPWNFYNTVYQGGSFRNALLVDWLEGQDAAYMLDLYEEHPLYDDVWSMLDLRTREERISIPMFHWGGWYDVFTEGPLEAFADLYENTLSGTAGQQWLMMGPWTHMDDGAFSPVQGELTYPNDSIVPWDFANPIDYFKVQLQGKKDTPAQPTDWPVRFYVMGDVDNAQSEGNHWEIAQGWPLPTTARSLYLRDGSTLSFSAPTLSNQFKTYVADPANPVPTIGGGELSLPAGPHDQRPNATRSDVLTFTTDALVTPVKIAGMVKAKLYVASSAQDTDFNVRLIDVYPDGRAMLVTDGVLKARYRTGITTPTLLTPGQPVELTVSVGSTAIVFDEGHRIQVQISSSNYRRFEISRNTGDGVWGTAAPVVATNTVYFDAARPSQLILPEPQVGVTKPAPKRALPSRRLIQTALVKLERGLPLSAEEDDALALEAGQKLTYGMMGTIDAARNRF